MFEDYLVQIRAGHRIVASVLRRDPGVRAQGRSRDVRPLGGRPRIRQRRGRDGRQRRRRTAALAQASLATATCATGRRSASTWNWRWRSRGVCGNITILMTPTGSAVPLPHPPPPPPPPPRGLTFELPRDVHHQIGRRARSGRRVPRHHDFSAMWDHPQAMGLGCTGARGHLEMVPTAGPAGAAPQLVVKIGGLGLRFWGFRLEGRHRPHRVPGAAQLWRPYVEACIEFSPRSVIYGKATIRPDNRGFVPLLECFEAHRPSCSPEDKTARSQPMNAVFI